MKRDEAISRLQQHEADLKRLGVEHLYMFGSTARDEAGDDSDVDLFFDHEKGKLGLFELMDVKERAASILGGKTDDAQQSASPVKKADRRSRRADLLMTKRIVAPRLADIIEAIERIRRVLDGVTLEAFEQNWEKRWLVERGIEIISEASRYLTDEIKERRPEIPWPKVAGIGNVLRHAYDHVAPDVLWKLAQDDLAEIEKVCREELVVAEERERH